MQPGLSFFLRGASWGLLFAQVHACFESRRVCRAARWLMPNPTAENYNCAWFR
jgi:hypothetical protein